MRQLKGYQLQELIDEQTEKVLQESFGTFLRGTATGIKNFAQSDAVKSIGNVIKPGLGDDFQKFAQGKVDQIAKLPPCDKWAVQHRDSDDLYNADAFFREAKITEASAQDSYRKFFSQCRVEDKLPTASNYNAFICGNALR